MRFVPYFDHDEKFSRDMLIKYKVLRFDTSFCLIDRYFTNVCGGYLAPMSDAFDVVKGHENVHQVTVKAVQHADGSPLKHKILERATRDSFDTLAALEVIAG